MSAAASSAERESVTARVRLPSSIAVVSSLPRFPRVEKTVSRSPTSLLSSTLRVARVRETVWTGSVRRPSLRSAPRSCPSRPPTAPFASFEEDGDVGLRVRVEDPGELVDGDEGRRLARLDWLIAWQWAGAGMSRVDVHQQVLQRARRPQLRGRVREELALHARVQAQGHQSHTVLVADVGDLPLGGAGDGSGGAVGRVEALGVGELDLHLVLRGGDERHADGLLVERVAEEDRRGDDLDDDGEPPERDAPGLSRRRDEAAQEPQQLDGEAQDCPDHWHNPAAWRAVAACGLIRAITAHDGTPRPLAVAFGSPYAPSRSRCPAPSGFWLSDW